MIDSFGRKINYLRVSVTQRCNLNCVYCGTQSPDYNELTPNEILKIVNAFAKCGIDKVRLTGGEPLVRSDIAEIASKLRTVETIKKLVLTTNGVLLKKYAYSLKEAGVSAVNISLDSLNREKYKEITGADCLNSVIEGIDAAQKAGLKVRINSVLIKGKNDGEAESLIELAKDRNIDVRFIELMPFSDTGDNKNLIVTGRELAEKFDFLRPVKADNGFEQSVAKYYEADGYKGKIGFISPVSSKFCNECNRIRLLSDGKIRPCLGYDKSYDVMPYIDDENRLEEEIKKIIYSKPSGHSFSCEYGSMRAMNKIGG